MTALAHFYRRPVQNNAKSRQLGRPVFDELDYIKILFPGQEKSVTDRAVKDEDKTRFSAQWDRYQQGLEQVQEGTPIQAWPQLSPGEIATLKTSGIHTIEALRDLNDAQVDGIQGGISLRRRATEYLNQLAPVSQSAALASDAATMLKDIEKMTEDADGLAIISEDTAQNALTLRSMIHMQIETVEQAQTALQTHFDAEIKRFEDQRTDLMTKLEQASEQLKSVVPALEAKMKEWRKEATKLAKEKGEEPPPAATVPLNPGKAEITAGEGMDPADKDSFYDVGK